MMTEQRKKRLKSKIQQARGRLMETHPFFALLLMYLKFVAVPEMKKISTNGRCIYFSPDFVDKLYQHELDYILCHQIMHIICGQIWRPYGFAGDDYHFACDILINVLLSNIGFGEERYAHLGYVYRTIPSVDKDLSELTPEEIHDSLPYSLYVFDDRTRSKFLPDCDLWWDQKEDNGLSGEMILDLPEMEGMLKTGNKGAAGNNVSSGGGDGLQQDWQARTVAAAISAASTEENNKGVSNIPAFAMRMITELKKPVVDWKKVLNDFVQEQICDYSFSPPDRRFSDTDFFLPDFNEHDFVSKEVLFMADTSGSVKDEDLALVYSEMRGAIEQFGGKLKGKLGFFDTKVTDAIPFENIEDLMRIIPYGGGGTDFGVIFDYIRQLNVERQPACVVIFTDGEGPYPSESVAMGIPVLWLINNLDITPPWGKITRFINSFE